MPGMFLRKEVDKQPLKRRRPHSGRLFFDVVLTFSRYREGREHCENCSGPNMSMCFEKENWMLRKAKDLNGYKLDARDGEIGKVKEFYFDDHSWTVRYLVADTGGWLSGRTVLISPYALDPANEGGKVIPVDLTKAQIEKSPSLDTDRPVSRQYEWEYFSFYGWPAYWDGPYTWGPSAYPTRAQNRWSGSISS